MNRARETALELPNSYRPGPVPTTAQDVHQQTILSSHERSLAFGLLPQHAADLSRLDPAALQELQHRNTRLCAQALPVMEMLHEQLAHAQSMVLLTDASGVVLHALGDAGFLQKAQTVALAPGALWSEARKGTNAIGTALMTERPTLVHGQEHFLKAMHFLTCSAAPIFDHKGALLGVIDVSGDRRSYHPHTLALAGMAARLIETQWFADKFRHSLRLHFHAQAAGLGTLNECVLALDESGGVLGANRRALELLGAAAPHLRRESVQSLFGVTLGALADLSRQHGHVVLALRTGHHAEPVHVFAKLSINRMSGGSIVAHEEPSDTAPAPLLHIAPSDPLVLTRASHGTAVLSLRDNEMKTIQAALNTCGGNLSLAARQLGIGRSTLYRKLKSGGLVSSPHG
ncbi:helix-turn-helix domain-containing protein [Pelomonas sp. KK5]|uniref:helix-turn-helix domain-containing protein n=1 Tax=Pelomonas sp. KK5 TaxID=1855730 RepID=UPI0009FA4569|nr:helix-turn-helix domain-containing protein [Pelomonas sp. KK5]